MLSVLSHLQNKYFDNIRLIEKNIHHKYWGISMNKNHKCINYQFKIIKIYMIKVSAKNKIKKNKKKWMNYKQMINQWQISSKYTVDK